MQSATDNIERHCLNNIAELEKCIDDFINWLTKHGVSPHTLYLARFIIEEMGTNIIKYGYDDNNTHTFFLKLSLAPCKLYILLKDDGHEFNPLNTPTPNLSGGLEERTPGGLGIWLVQKFGKMEYERTKDHKNIIRVTLKLDCVMGDK